jgi:tetratricopeptide (TPR) repeat protein
MKPRQGEGMGDQQRNLYAVLIIILAVTTVFLPVTGFEFLSYDDPINVYENPLITDFSWASLQRFWKGPYEGLYVPMTYSVWGFLAGLSGIFNSGHGSTPDPTVFHAANLLIHLASVLVLFRLLRRLFKDVSAAAAGALFFGLHPVQVEAVAWVTGMKDLLGGLFAILALEGYLLYATSSEKVQKQVVLRRYGLAGLFFVLALLAKPSSVPVPLLAGVIGYFCLDRPPKLLARELGPWLLLTIPVLIVTRASQPGGDLDFSFWQRLLVAGDALTFYLAKLFWPVNLAPDYGRTPAYILGQGWAYATLLPPLVLAGLLCWKWRAPQLRAGVLVFVLALSPVLGLVSFDFQMISTVADRYLYLAIIGPGLLIAWLFCRFRSRRVALLVFSGLALLALGSRLALRHWHDSFSFNSHALLVNPLSSTAYNNLGVAYCNSGNFREALDVYRRAIEIEPKDPNAYVNIGNLYEKAKMAGEAISFYQKALLLVPRSSGHVYRKIGDAYKSLGEQEKALTNYHHALYYYRLEGAAGFELASVHVSIGMLYKGMGRNDEAIEAYRRALLEKPDFAEVFSNLGVIYEEQGRTGEAEENYRRAVAGKPVLAEPYNNLGLIYLARHREQEALVLFRKAVELSVRQPVPHSNLGRVYLALGQYEPALAAFQQALTFNPGFAPALAGLAQTYRRMDREDLAVTYEAKARALGYVEPLTAIGDLPSKQLGRP